MIDGPHEKFSATVPAKTAARARERVAAGMASTFSAYVARALEHENMARTLDDVLRDLDSAHGPVSDEDEAWARRVLGA